MTPPFSFDLLGCARARRLKWAGQLLRAEESFLPRRVAMVELEQSAGAGQPGGIFQDAPKGRTVEELVELAQDKGQWEQGEKKLKGKRSAEEPRRAKKKKGLADEFWLAAGYCLCEGQWKKNEEVE